MNNLLFCAVERRHHLAGGIEGTFCDAGHGLFRLPFMKTLLFRKGHECRLRRFSLDRPFLIRLRITAQRHGFRQELPVSKSSDNRHPVLCQRSRLIRTNHIGAAQSLHRCQPAHNGIGLRHTCDTQRQNQRNNGRQPFRNRRDSKRDRDHEHLQNCAQVSFRSHHHIENKDENADENDHHRQLFAKLVQLLLQRRLTVLCLVQNTGDLSHFRPHPCVRYQKPASSIGDAASHKSHIFAVTQRYLSVLFLLQHFHKFLYGYRLSCQGGLVYTQRLRLQQPAVSRNHISCFQKHDISRYQAAAGNLLLFSVTDDMAGCRRHFLQRLHRVFRLALLKNSQSGVQPYHDQNDKYLCHGFSGNHIGNRRDNRRSKKHDQHRVFQFIQKLLKNVLFSCFLQLVLSVLLQPFSGFFFRDPCVPAPQLRLKFTQLFLINFRHTIRSLSVFCSDSMIYKSLITCFLYAHSPFADFPESRKTDACSCSYVFQGHTPIPAGMIGL